VDYVRTVLEIIPRSMFHTLGQIVDSQTSKLAATPTRFERERLKEHARRGSQGGALTRACRYAQLDERHMLARLTHDISVFAEVRAGR
jgi:WASH complex subunit strumpellin